MKEIISILSLMLLMTQNINAQSAKATELAQKISQQMTDSLKITEQEKNGIYAVNIKLHNEKMVWRLRFAETDSLAKYFQIVENTRDSLYKSVLPQAKYAEYIKRKNQFVRN